MYVTTCSVTFQLRTQTVPDSEQPSEDLIVENFVIVTPAHPEIPPRNWAIHVPKDTEKYGDLDPPTC